MHDDMVASRIPSESANFSQFGDEILVGLKAAIYDGRVGGFPSLHGVSPCRLADANFAPRKRIEYGPQYTKWVKCRQCMGNASSSYPSFPCARE